MFSFSENSPIILEEWEKHKDHFEMLLSKGKFYNAFALAFLLGSNDQAVKTVLKYGYITNEFQLVVEKIKKYFPQPEKWMS
jgi:hypothetical protein